MNSNFDRVYQHFPEQANAIEQFIEGDAEFREICRDFQEVALLIESLAAEIRDYLGTLQDTTSIGNE